MSSLSHLGLLASRNLWRQPRRTAIAISAVSVGIVALILANGFIEWIFFDMRESTIHAHLGHLQVVRPGYHDAGRADPSGYLLPMAGPELKSVATAPSVRVVSPRLSFTGLASHAETTVSFIADAVDPAREIELSRALNVVEGERLRAGDGDGALFGVGLARNLGVGVGDRVVLLVNKASGGINAVELTVRGLFSTITKAYDDSALRLPIETAQKLLSVQGAHVWVALLDDTRHTDAVADDLRARLPGRFEVVPWHRLADFYNKTVALFSRQIQVVKVIIAAIIVLSITNTMMINVTERTGEIGTAMAVGVPRREILGLFVTEALLLGLFGGVLGVALGVVLAAIISAIGIPMPAPPGMAHGFMGQIRVTADLAIEAFAIAVATTVLASLYPAFKASRLAVVDALRHNH